MALLPYNAVQCFLATNATTALIPPTSQDGPATDVHLTSVGSELQGSGNNIAPAQQPRIRAYVS